jgi:hypothetical protein
MKDELIKILQNQDLLDDKTYKQQADEILNLLQFARGITKLKCKTTKIEMF